MRRIASPLALAAVLLAGRAVHALRVEHRRTRWVNAHTTDPIGAAMHAWWQE